MIASLITAGLSIIDKVVPDPTAKAEAQRKLIELQQSGELKQLEAQMSVVTAEASSEHWLTSTWRPITMLTFVAIIANNYIIYPYLSLFWSAAPVLEVPEQLWSLLTIGLGGYVAGRSLEKVTQAYRSKP